MGRWYQPQGTFGQGSEVHPERSRFAAALESGRDIGFGGVTDGPCSTCTRYYSPLGGKLVVMNMGMKWPEAAF